MEAQQLVAGLIEAGWTQMQIATRIGVGQASVSKVFRGKVPDVMSVTYRRLLALHTEVVSLPLDRSSTSRAQHGVRDAA